MAINLFDMALKERKHLGSVLIAKTIVSKFSYILLPAKKVIFLIKLSNTCEFSLSSPSLTALATRLRSLSFDLDR